MTDAGPLPSKRELIAPLRHTGLLLLIILGITAFGFYSQKYSLTAAAPASPGSKTFLYLSLVALQYGLLRFILIGLRRKGITLGSIIGAKENNLRTLGLDLLLAVVFFAVCAGISKVIKTWLGGVDNHVSGLLPNGLLESELWIVVSVAAGFVEEVCYRGYLQKQLLALTGSAALAIIGQAVLFAISHSYQGMKSVMIIFGYGAMFGLLAYWRDSLRPGIIAHALTDIVGGLVR